MFSRELRMAAAVAAVAIGIAITAFAGPAWAQGVALGGGAGGQAFVAWIMGPAGLGSIVGLLIGLGGLVMMAGRHTWEGILFLVVGAMIVGGANTIAGYFA